MPMSPFFLRCLETAKAETRTVAFLDESYGVPPGELVFDQLYCDEVGCDCRRVILMVRVADDFDQCLAVINFGWESPEFYQKWSKALDPDESALMAGPSLETFARQSRYADGIFEYTKNHPLTDADYVARLQRHYTQFKATLRRGSGGKSTLNWRRRIRPGGGGKGR